MSINGSAINPANQTGFRRMDGHTLEQGRIVAYRLVGYGFTVMASRDGIEIEGRTPVFGEAGVRVFQDVMDRALVHHKHLASTPLGDPQKPLTEEQVKARIIGRAEIDEELNRFNNQPRMLKIID